MHTLGMVLTITGFCFCWLPGFFGWLGITMAAVGTIIGITGMTSVKTSPSGLGMNTASHVYGILTGIFGISFKLKYNQNQLASFLPSLDLLTGFAIFAGLTVLFYAALIIGRKKYRILFESAGLALFLTMIFVGISAIMTADKNGIVLNL